jgi:hypothetical protein
MTEGDVRALMNGLLPAVRALVDRRVTERLHDLGVVPRGADHGAVSGLSVAGFHQTDLRDLTSCGTAKGAWNADRWFTATDLVRHKEATYRCLSGNCKIEPGTDSTQWVRLPCACETPCACAPDDGRRFKGAWDPDRAYGYDEIVVYYGSGWRCARSHRGLEPGGYGHHDDVGWVLLS